LERRPDGLFELKEITFRDAAKMPGLSLSAKLDREGEDRIVIRDLSLQLRTVGKRKPIEGVGLDVGEPVLPVREQTVTIAVRPGRDESIPFGRQPPAGAASPPERLGEPRKPISLCRRNAPVVLWRSCAMLRSTTPCLSPCPSPCPDGREARASRSPCPCGRYGRSGTGSGSVRLTIVRRTLLIFVQLGDEETTAVSRESVTVIREDQ